MGGGHQGQFNLHQFPPAIRIDPGLADAAVFNHHVQGFHHPPIHPLVDLEVDPSRQLLHSQWTTRQNRVLHSLLQQDQVRVQLERDSGFNRYAAAASLPTNLQCCALALLLLFFIAGF